MPLFLKLLFIFLICFISHSCQEDPKNNLNQRIEIKDEIFPKIKIDLAKKTTSRLDSILKVISIIPLEQTESSLVARVGKVIFNDNRYYLLDEEQNAIVIFSITGDFQRKIDHLGEGPGEYYSIADFEINPFTKNLEILSPEGNFLVYSINDELISSFRLPPKVRAVHHFKNLSEDIIVFYATYERKNLLFYSRKRMQFIHSMQTVPEDIHRKIPYSFSTSPFDYFDGKLTYFELHSPTIAQIDSLSVIPEFQWDFGKNSFNWKKIKEIEEPKDVQNYLSSSSMVNWFLFNRRMGSKIITGFMFNGEPLVLIYDSEKLSYKIYSAVLNEGLYFPGLPATTLGDSLILVSNPSYIGGFLNEEILEDNYLKTFNEIRKSNLPAIITYQLID